MAKSKHVILTRREALLLSTTAGLGAALSKSAFGSDSVMTNATVGTVAEAPEGRVVHVKFKDGESEYSIGPDVPILAPVPGDKSLLTPGAAVFLAGPKAEDGTVKAAFMYVEKDGIKPPM